MAPRHLFIVARAHPSVYEYLAQQFTADADVEVRMDRRRADRRTRPGAVDNERRQADRRTRPDVDAQLRERSHFFLTLPDPAPAEDRTPV